MEISSFIVVYRWSGPTEEQRRLAVANWRKIVEIQSHPWDFCELNNETCDMVKSYRSENLKYVYSAPHGFFYDKGAGDVRSMLKYAGDDLSHVLFADTYNQTKDCRYILNPPWLNTMGKEDVSIHQHNPLGEGDVDFDGIFETLREIVSFLGRGLPPPPNKVLKRRFDCLRTTPNFTV